MLYFSLSFYLPLSLSLSLSLSPLRVRHANPLFRGSMPEIYIPLRIPSYPRYSEWFFPASCENLGLGNSREKNSSELYFLFACTPFYRPFLFDQNYRLYPRIILAKREITINHINQTTFSWAFQATLTQDSRVSLLAKRGIKQFWGSIIL